MGLSAVSAYTAYYIYSRYSFYSASEIHSILFIGYYHCCYVTQYEWSQYSKPLSLAISFRLKLKKNGTVDILHRTSSC